MLANGQTHADVAAGLGITTKTVGRWCVKPEFAEALSKTQVRAVDKVVERSAEEIARQSQEVIQRLVPKALRVLNSYLDDPTAKGSDRLRACHIIGSWAGLNQSQTKQEPTDAEASLKQYMELLAQNGKNNRPADQH